jgi:hypothetical protein
MLGSKVSNGISLCSYHLLAMEQPHARVIGLESKYDMAIWIKNKGISSHRNGGVIGLTRVRRIEISCFFLGPYNSLEVVTVQVERVLSRIWEIISTLQQTIV